MSKKKTTTYFDISRLSIRFHLDERIQINYERFNRFLKWDDKSYLFIDNRKQTACA